jgi:MscS family membrane protein
MKLEELFTSISQQINEILGFSNQLYGELIISSIVLICFLILGWIVEHIISHYFEKFAKKTKTKLDDEILKNIKKPIYVLVIFFGIHYFTQNITVFYTYVDRHIVNSIFLLIQIFLIAYIFTRITNVIIAWYAEQRQKKHKTSQHILYVFRSVFNGIIYLIAFFVFMAFSGIDLTGLAIGGAASAIVIGFALQHVLSDFFSAFSIFLINPLKLVILSLLVNLQAP